MNDELAGFVKEGLQRGIPRKQIGDALSKAGWTGPEVQRALNSFAEGDFPVPVPRPAAYVSAREAFIYLVSFTTLGLSAYAAGDVLFEFINRGFPAPTPPPITQPVLETIRWSLASLLVAFPVFLLVDREIARMVRADPAKLVSQIRQQVTYLTLFIASCVLLGDFTVLVYNFLGSELTARFLLKVVTAGAIAGAVFLYHLRDLPRDEKPSTG